MVLNLPSLSELEINTEQEFPFKKSNLEFIKASKKLYYPYYPIKIVLLKFYNSYTMELESKFCLKCPNLWLWPIIALKDLLKTLKFR